MFPKPLCTFSGSLSTAHCSLFSSFLASTLLSASFLISCTPQTSQPPLQTTFYVYRFEPPALVEFFNGFQPIREIPFSIPSNCGLLGLFPAPVGEFIAVELNCPNGQTVLFLDPSTQLRQSGQRSETASVPQPVINTDSHFLSWTPDGKAAYLKVDSLGDARVVRAYADGSQDFIPITEFTYDLAPSADEGEFTFTFSRGLGQGSELWLAKQDGRIVQQLYADQFNYISFARWSPDGSQIAFIKIPDAQTPFTVGELWVIPSTSAQGADGSNARKLADADAGHGYAANWSPDGKKIAFVLRENPEDENADQLSEALTSNIYTVEVESRKLNQVTKFDNARVEAPFWSPDGNTLAFTIVLNGRMQVQIADTLTGETRSLLTESTCCPAWLRK
jgi:Tol biopolymer transport system component